ncbi:MAG TPA: hypothetical protein VGH86_12165 [Phenylobacterium sp.]
MPEYKLYLVDEDGHFVGAFDLTCPDDDAAIAIVKKRADPCATELWQLGRLVRRFPAADSRA